ncbi:MAG TPA: TIGR04283 family arsenosugar biosynthesis glycosyltransferase [Bryobacteraceae bacterium]|jgi:rSAM/selenodomain-associated transferase 2
MTFSIIIPTLNEKAALPATLRAIFAMHGSLEVIVADGGSADNTVEIARSAGAMVIHAERGRGQQQAAGAAHATGDVLWFVHADSIPASEALEAIASRLEDSRVAAGSLTPIFDDDSGASRALTLAYPYFRLLGLCYGDSGIFIRRSAYDAIGGFRAYPLFEDVDLVRRVKRIGRFVRLPCHMITSSRRFEGRSFLKTFVHWTLLQTLFWIGISPFKLARMYADIRRGK